MFINPLPPPGCVFLSHLSPVSISPLGICAFNQQTVPSGVRPPQSGQVLVFSDITSSSTDGADLLVNNQRLARCVNAKQAKRLSSLIKTITTAAPADRERLVRAYVAKQFAADEAAAVFREGAATMRLLRWMCSILFLFLFTLTPILVSIFGLLRVFIPVAVGMLILTIQLSIIFYRAHRKLYEGERSERVESAVKILLCPPVSIRAADFLTKNLLSEYSPVVLATLFAGPGKHQFLRAFIRDLQHPLKHEISDETAVGIIDWAGAEQLRMCLEYVQQHSGLPAGLLESAEPEGDSVSYCPRCGSQFVVSSGECPDCPGVVRVTFSAS